MSGFIMNCIANNFQSGSVYVDLCTALSWYLEIHALQEPVIVVCSSQETLSARLRIYSRGPYSSLMVRHH